MRRRRPRQARGFYSADNYASYALAVRQPLGYSMADATIHRATEDFAFAVIPDFEEDSLRVRCHDQTVADLVSSQLSERSSRSELWAQPNMAMELHSWIGSLMEGGRLYVHFGFSRQDDHAPYLLDFAVWLAPETIVVRSQGADSLYEQYVSRRAFESSGVLVVGEPQEHYEIYSADEILAIYWPLSDGEISPVRGARKASSSIDRWAKRMLLNSAAGAQPNETFLSVARARAGAYANALELEKLATAIAGDRLFLPVDDEVTEYFHVDRLIRSRAAAAQVRHHLFEQISRQLLDRWSALNGWPTMDLELRRPLWSIDDWKSLRRDYDRGLATLADVQAAASAEAETLRSLRAQRAGVEKKPPQSDP